MADMLDWARVESGDRLPGFDLFLSHTMMALQVSGSQDWNLIHHDPDYARESGHDGAFCNTTWTQAMLMRVATDWIGAVGWVLALDYRMTRMNRLGDRIAARGRVVSVADDRQALTAEITLQNEREGVTTIAAMTIVPLSTVDLQASDGQIAPVP